MQENTILFAGSHLSGEALNRAQDFTKNTLDIKSSTGIGATTAVLNITAHDVLIVFPLKGVIEAKEAKRKTFKSVNQFFIYGNSSDRWSDVVNYYESYGDQATNIIICTTAEQILKVRDELPELYLKLKTKPLFIDEIHLFTQEWRISLATFINVVRNEWLNNYKLSTATPIRNFAEIFGNNFDICTLKREQEQPKKLLKTTSVKDAWLYVFSEMEKGRNVVIFSNDIQHHKKEFMEDRRINLTGDGLKHKLSAFGKGLDHFKDEIDTTFLNKFPLIFCSSKYLTGYDIEPTKETSILILTNNKDNATSYSVEDIIQAYGRVRCNLVNALVCITKVFNPMLPEELQQSKVNANSLYNLTKDAEQFTPKDRKFNIKSYNRLSFDANGYASKLLAYDSYLVAESNYIMYNSFDAFMLQNGFIVDALELKLSNEDCFFIGEVQVTKKKILKSVTISNQIDNIVKGQEGKNIYNTILKLAANPKTKRNKSGYSCEVISQYCIGAFIKYLPAEVFGIIKYKDQRRLRELCNQLILYFNTNFQDANLKQQGKKCFQYEHSEILKSDFEYKIPPDEFLELVRIFRYCVNNMNMNFDTIGVESQKTINLFYFINKYRSIYQKDSRIKSEVLEQMKGYNLNDKDIIRIDKQIATKGVNYIKKSNQKAISQKQFIQMNIQQIKDASMYLLSRNKNFVSSYVDGRQYNPLTQISTVFRENFLYNYTSTDVVSANAQFTDKIIKSNIGLSVYENLMKVRNISRSEAKVLYNMCLNNYKMKISDAYAIYFDCGYTDAEAYKLANLTAGTAKGSYFKLMASAEEKIIDAYNRKYCSNSNALRLHDSLIMENTGLTFPSECNGVIFKVDIF